MRALILATLVATGVAAVVLTGCETDASHSQPVVQAPPPAPPPTPVVQAPPPVIEAPWPANVPSFKPGTGGVPLVAAMTTTAAAPATAISVQGATTGRSAVAPTTSNQVAALPPAPINPSANPTKVVLQAAIMQGAKPLRDPLVWTISLPMAGTLTTPGQLVTTANGPKAEFSLAPGTYVVTIKDAEAVVNSVMIVGTEPIAKIIPMNFAVVGLRMIPYTGGKIVAQPIHWEVFSNALGPPSGASKIGDALAPQTIFLLPAGFYVVRSQYSDVHADLGIHIEAGVTYSYTVDLYAATLDAKAIAVSGKAPKVDISWQVIRMAVDAGGQHQVVATDTGASPEFLLREGDYMVIAVGADGSTGQTPITVRAGKIHKVTVKLLPATKTPTSTSG